MVQETSEKLNSLSKLREEIKSLRSFVIGVLGKDREGEYSPEFIHKTLKATQEKADFTFKNKKEFLKQIKGKR